LRRRLLFPEGTDPRVLSAASFLSRAGIARPVLLGDPSTIKGGAGELGVSLEGVELLDPAGLDRAAYAQRLFEKKKAKGLTLDEARRLAEDPLYQAALLLADGKADGMAGGAVRSTADTVRAGFTGVGLAPGGSMAFGWFLMECPHAPGGARRVMFADSAVSPHPSPRALAAVAGQAAAVFKAYVNEEPRVAMLSFSTKGSAEDESVTETREAVELARKKFPGLAVDGELQGDAALVDHIAAQKGVTDGAVAGRANVLIFPDLNAGNIAYKLVQHLGGARAVGPVLSGLAKPVTDLSRGCTDEDIVDAAALLSLM
jgi:phosphate acetyltransferase